MVTTAFDGLDHDMIYLLSLTRTKRSITITMTAHDIVDPVDSVSTSAMSTLDQLSLSDQPLAYHMTQLTGEDWRRLGVSQDFHQKILTTLFVQLSQAPSQDEPDDDAEGQRDTVSPSLLTRPIDLQRLLEVSAQTLESTQRRLFQITARRHLELLAEGEWLAIEEREVRLTLDRVNALKRQLSINMTGELVVGHIAFTPSTATQSVEASEISETTIVEERDLDSPQEVPRALEYVDPFNHISHGIESPFTIRRLDQIITYLDDVLLPRQQVGELLNIPLDDRDILFDAMIRLEMINQEGEYIKLDFLGVRIARLSREDRLKQLAVIASRLRREAKLRSR